MNVEQKEAEIKGVEVVEDAEKHELIEDLKLMDDLLKQLLQIINNLGDTTDISREIAILDIGTGASTMLVKGKDPEIQKLLIAIRHKLNGERKKAVDKAKANISTKILVEEKKELDVRLSKAVEALTKIKEQQYHDGLVEDEIFKLDPSVESRLITEAFEEIGDDVWNRNKVSDDVINSIKDLFNIISQDSRDIIISVLTNRISEGDVFDLSLVPTRVATGLFVRFLSRVLYSGTNLNEREGDSMVEGFLNHNGTLEGQNQGVVSRLVNALHLVVPRPPPLIALIERPSPFPALFDGGGLRKKKTRIATIAEPAVGRSVIQPSSRRETDDFLVSFNRDLNQDLETVGEQKEGTFKGLFDRMERKTAEFARSSGVSIEIKDMSDDEFEEQLREMEDLKANLGIVAKALATASIVSSQAESIRNFASSKLPNFDIPVDVIRNSLRNTPNEIPNMLKGVARGIAPIFRRRPGENIRYGRIVHIIMGVLLSGIYSSIVSTTQKTLEQERETDTTEAKRGTTSEFVKGEEKVVPVEDIDKPVGSGLLRADFEMVGIDFFNKQFATTPLDMQNSEWAEYNYVPNTDRQNNIELDNSFSESIRFQEPMFLPKYQPRIKPPSQLAVNMGRDRMTPAIQLNQGFAPKFSGAVNVYDNLSYTFNSDAFSRSWEDNKLYHPDTSIF